MSYMTRMCQHCGFKVHAIADEEEDANDLCRKLLEDNKRHKASCWYERLSPEQQMDSAVKQILEMKDED